MPDAFTINFDTEGLEAALWDVADGVEQATRPAAQAGARVLYEEVLQRAPQSEAQAAHFFHGSSYKTTGQKYLFYSGDLKRAIYHVFSADNSLPHADAFQYQRATYHVSWNYKKAPYGHWIENGTSRMSAKPFLAPAYYAAVERALDAAEVTYFAGLDEVLARTGL